jgi:hypothetical protein
MVRAGVLAVTLTLCACLPGAASATQSASISARFTPERLGAPTTVTLGFHITASGGRIPSPLTGIDFRYPTDIPLATSELGTASCPAEEIEAHGPSVCPPNSRMGTGSATVKIPVGGGVQSESASIALLAGPSPSGFLSVLATATGLSPVIARVVIPSQLLEGHLKLTVPLVESVAGGTDVSVVAMHVTLGGNLTYYETRHGKTVAYRPTPVLLPRQCPRGGFRFSATFSFLDGSRAQARKIVACPRGR